MPSDATGVFEDSCKKIHAEVGRSWEWDARFTSALLVFPSEEEAEILGIVAKFATRSWTFDDIRSAPATVQELADVWGGLRPGQRFLHSETTASPILICALWPWGSGKSISLRVGFAASSEEQVIATRELLKACFGTD
jgi:hypothetical protein